MAGYARQLGQTAGLPPERLAILEEAALIHDVGKIGVPESILNKPASLTGEEYRMVRQHVQLGVEIVGTVGYLDERARIIQCHHERYDGAAVSGRIGANLCEHTH